MTTEELGALNGSILAGDATYLDGRQARETLSSGLVTEDGRHAYREDDGILFLSMPWAIPVYRAASDVVTLDEVTESVRDFYDDVGWTRLEGGPFADAADFEDLRPVSRRYIHECHVRLSRYLDRGGRYLLDAGSGPIQYPEYLAYSEGYRTRICLDISVSALREAQKTLQERGIFILGDISRLPLADSSVDGVVSLHTIYHLAKDRQEAAIREIYRVLAPGRRAAIVYQWKDSSLNRVLDGARRREEARGKDSPEDGRATHRNLPRAAGLNSGEETLRGTAAVSMVCQPALGLRVSDLRVAHGQRRCASTVRL